GNLFKRTLDMQKKYFAGVVQAPSAPEPLDDQLKAAAADAYATVVKSMDTYHIADAVSSIFVFLRRANKYIDETLPWTLYKDESKHARLGTVLYNLLESLRVAAVLLMPFIPQTAEEILKGLNAKAELDSLEETARETGHPNGGYLLFSKFANFGGLVPGSVVGESKVLFARIDEKAYLEKLYAEKQKAADACQSEAAKPASTGAVQTKPEGCAQISIEDFMKVELRSAKVISAEPVPKAKKLLKLELDLGYEQRQVVSGIAKFYKPEDLIGRNVVLVANLKPATICGIESQGMILASGEETIRVVFLSDDTPPGERIR
ncbi:MAG TPA: methionine--tRNA ligase subunit beta, partial [Bacillota bacterium]|nr:methionine--tRNA ligase subunit beta [Bacillota bacterium]